MDPIPNIPTLQVYQVPTLRSWQIQQPYVPPVEKPTAFTWGNVGIGILVAAGIVIVSKFLAD